MRFPFMTVKDAANAIGVTPARVYQWIAEGVVDPIRPHGRSTFLTHAQVGKLKRMPRSKTGRPRISLKRA